MATHAEHYSNADELNQITRARELNRLRVEKHRKGKISRTTLFTEAQDAKIDELWDRAPNHGGTRSEFIFRALEVGAAMLANAGQPVGHHYVKVGGKLVLDKPWSMKLPCNEGGGEIETDYAGKRVMFVVFWCPFCGQEQRSQHKVFLSRGKRCGKCNALARQWESTLTIPERVRDILAGSVLAGSFYGCMAKETEALLVRMGYLGYYESRAVTTNLGCAIQQRIKENEQS